MDFDEIGQRIRRLRLINQLGQVEFAEAIGIAGGSVSRLENGLMPIPSDLAERIANVVGCSTQLLLSPTTIGPATRPWLRAYADAPQRALDRQVADCTFAVEIIDRLDLRRIPDTLPTYGGDLNDDHGIERFAQDVRAAAGLKDHDVVGNAIRAAERLGCVVLPMASEIGPRHMGLSLRADQVPLVCVSRPSEDRERHVPGDRQRFTVAHELGHLTLHGTQRPPQGAADAAAIERQAHRFAGAFLAPGDAMLQELDEVGGRVTLSTLSKIKERWGVAIKMLVTRLRDLEIIDAEAARSLYKQISARGWNRREPITVGNESAIWFERALLQIGGPGNNGRAQLASRAGVSPRYLTRWTDWTPTPAVNPVHDDIGNVISMGSRRSIRDGRREQHRQS